MFDGIRVWLLPLVMDYGPQELMGRKIRRVDFYASLVHGVWHVELAAMPPYQGTRGYDTMVNALLSSKSAQESLSASQTKCENNDFERSNKAVANFFRRWLVFLSPPWWYLRCGTRRTATAKTLFFCTTQVLQQLATECIRSYGRMTHQHEGGILIGLLSCSFVLFSSRWKCRQKQALPPPMRIQLPRIASVAKFRCQGRKIPNLFFTIWQRK